ncbi:uncharacterized protein LOC127131464 [Lathyrus oleraceus]|uniref:uncharacterized protein LOC127131464 n=1 Tax=Pisum sativum TaxID=3888 RepID=UPI0021D2D0EB|nr:uncharacterized protein LOC127131464 [Pisum sativum]
MAHMMHDISVDQFDDVVANISIRRYLVFNEAELTIEGNNHNKALHIFVTHADTLTSRVLVDIGSSLNVLSKSTLILLHYEGLEIRASALIVRAFDGSQREVIGEVDLIICMGDCHFTITFQVMDIHPAYSCRLGRPWIHAVGVVTSTMHQKLKYVETEEGIIEVPFQGLYFEEVSSTSVGQGQSTTLVLSSAKSAKQTLENGPLPRWGQIMKVSKKRDRFGLEYRPTSHHLAARGDMPRLETNIIEHCLPYKPECPPVKQKLHRTRPDMAPKIKEEVKNQFDAGFLDIIEYSQWVSNIVSVPNKDGKV